MEKKDFFEPRPETAVVASERGETTLDRLERQILSARELYDKIQSIPANWPHEEVERQLNEIDRSVLSKLPLDKQKKIFELQELEKQIAKKYRSRYTANTPLELNVLYDQTSLLREDKDVFFMEQTRDLLRFLAVKNRWIQKYRQDSAALFKDVRKALGTRRKILFPPGALNSIEYTAFGVQFFLASEFYRKFFKHSTGIYRPRRSFSFISDDSEGLMTARHEAVHNFLDGLSFFATRRYSTVRKAELLMRLVELDAPTVVVKSARDSFFSAKATDEVDALHNEWLAALEEAEADDFSVCRRKLPTDPKESLMEALFAESDRTVFRATVPSLATAQNNALKFSVNLKKLINSGRAKGEVLRHLRTIDRQFTPLFFKAVRDCRDALNIGRRIGVEADEFVHFAMVVLPPSKFGFAQILLEKKFGEKYHRAKRQYSLVRDAALTPGYLFFLSESLNKKEPLAKEDFRMILKKLAEGEVAEIFDLNDVLSLEQIRRSIRIIEELKERGLTVCGLSGREDFIDSWRFHFFSNFLKTIIAGQEWPAEWFSITDEERRCLSDVLKNETEDGEFCFHLGKGVDLFKTSFWQMVEKLGLAAELRPIVNEQIGD